MLPLLLSAALAALAAPPSDPVGLLLVQAERDRSGAIAGLRALDTTPATAWADWLAAPPDPGAPDAAERLRAVGDAASDATVPCWLLRDRPDAAAAFGAWYGSSRDAFPPLCRPDLFDSAPWEKLLDALVRVASSLQDGAWCGTMSTAVARDAYIEHLTRHLRGSGRDDDAEQARSAAALAWAHGLGLAELNPQLDGLTVALDAARSAGPAWWADAVVADRVEAARTCIGDRGEFRRNGEVR